MIARLLCVAFLFALATPSHAQQGAQAGAQQPTETQAQQDPDRPISYEEQVVVSASKTEQQLVNAPAAVSIVTSEIIQSSPATNVGELLRVVPGVNVMQTSARDFNITTRGATSTLATSQLALVDGRTIYLDFFGMVMWDLVPSNPNDIRQIEVIRGPASAVWGANAMSGVVNVITKTPRELAAEGGTSLTIGVGGFERSLPGRDQGAGSLLYINGSHAQAVDERWSYKLSAGYHTQDALPRPTGVIPNAFRTPYPSFQNEGTSQPKFDARVDYEMTTGSRLTFSGGIAGTEGLIYSGLGPFDVDSATNLSYFTTRYARGGTRVAVFTNLLDGNASNLLTVGPDLRPIALVFDTKTFDVEAGDVRAIGTRHLISYGGNYRHNTFDISLAPNGDDRNEGGAYVQDEIFLGDHFRWVVGGRVDKYSSIDDAVFSPRTTFMVKPAAAHTFRVSFNRAFRAPSFINNHIDTAIVSQLPLGLISPLLAGQVFNFPLRAVGNPALKQETLTAYEVGYIGVVKNRATVTAAVYWNETEDSINFAQTARFGAANPPPRWPLSPLVLEALALAGSPLPSTFSYVNLGAFTERGVELGVDAVVNRYVNVFANYSYQTDPDPEQANFNINELNRPPNNRFNTGFNFSYRRILGNLAVSYTDEAFWQDVLDSRFHGTSDAFTLVNAGFGVRWAGDRIVTSLKTMNLGNSEVQQHIFGDILKRQIVGEVRFTF